MFAPPDTKLIVFPVAVPADVSSKKSPRKFVRIVLPTIVGFPVPRVLIAVPVAVITLFWIKGVAAVRIRGGLEEEIHVRLEEEALRRTGVSIQQVIDRLAQENINVAGGTLKEGRTEYLVRTLNEYTEVSQIGETIVTSF